MTFLQYFSEHFKVTITHSMVRDFHNHLIAFEIRGNHPLAFNTPQIGVHLATFFNSDADFLFNLTGLDQKEMEQGIKLVVGSRLMQATNQQLKKEPQLFKVAHNPYNMLTIWLVHLAATARGLPEADRHQFQHDLLAMMNYQFFTSIVRHSYPHEANAEVMALAVENLSGKYDIKQENTSTWKLTIHQRADDIMGDGRGHGSIHANTIKTFAPDNKVIYVISDAQTRIKSRIVNLNRVFYKLKKQGDMIGDRSLIVEVEGESIIKHVEAVFDQMLSSLLMTVLQPDRLIHSDDLHNICLMVELRQEDMLRRLLIKFCEQCNQQANSNQYDLILGNKGKHPPYIVGYRALIQALITNTFSVLAKTSANDLHNKADILMQTRNLYRSSRVADEGVLQVKASVEYLITEYDISRRDSTKSALKIAFILYLMLLGLRNI